MSTINELLERYAAGKCSKAENQQVEDWLASYDNNNDDWLKKGEKQQKDWLDSTFSDINQIIDQKEAHVLIEKDRSKFINPLMIAASLLLAGSFAVWFFLFHQPQQENNNGRFTNNEILPGKNAATLVLADGNSIILSEAKKGIQITAAGVKYTDGSPVEHFELRKTSFSQSIGILRTPMGGQYQLVLADGTKIWLNAATSVSFTPDLTKSEKRTVTVDGEAYLEVAKAFLPADKTGHTSKMVPFIVKSREQEVTVLGTEFNVNSYTNEPTVKTTLLDGSVKVRPTSSLGQNTYGKTTLILKPGEQADLRGQQLSKEKVNIEEVIDWKDGDFVLDDQDLHAIMRKVARWYNVTVVYEGDAQPVKFLGTISRSKKLSSLLELLEANGKIHFKVKGRTVTVVQ